MRLRRAAMLGRSGELDFRLGSAFVIFPFFVKHLAGKTAVVADHR
jgi:hypothetical protein